ncbi:hypothetical protein K7X08_003932 [Anisodus acutangulus]|uniref:Uncharacterized protein n=1 Tax=Anisodus acutangulus TaxID=402998 RepID=A0A9Q1RJM4_9SOLA|nr:hypothetical protein K7X08_003932 [Anisodus acutangulus]
MVNNDDEKGKRNRKVKEHQTVENRPKTRSRKNFEVIPLVNTIKSVENIVADDEVEIEHEYEKSYDRDESDNERGESNRGTDHKDDGAKEGDEVDVVEEDNTDGGKDRDEDDKTDGERGRDGVVVVEEENTDGENEAEKLDEGDGDQNEGETEKGTTIETKVHPFLVPTHQETYQPFTRDFVPFGQDFPEIVFDRLIKELEGKSAITMAEAARDVGDVFGGVSGDGVGPSGSVDVKGVSTEEQLVKSNLKGDINEQSHEDSAVKNVKTLDLYKPVDIEKKKAYLSWINMKSDE